MKRTAIIMAGGTGERFWPLSRRTKPKQLLPLVSDKTMIEEAIERISGVIKPKDIIIVTSQTLLVPIREALPNFPPENVIAEPMKRNTAPCLALGAAFIIEKYKNEYLPNEISIAVLTADHNIEPKEKFAETVSVALDYVKSNKALAVIGIPPTRPDTGYGYVEIEKQFSEPEYIPEIGIAKAFHEKPNLEKAKGYVESGKFLWNSGMFFWRADTFIENMKKHLPEVGNKIEEMAACYKNKTSIALDESLAEITPIFEAFPNISIDYALMEKAENIVVAKALFNWDDVGSWDSLLRLHSQDDDGNIAKGNNSLVESQNSIIINTSTNHKIKFAGLGLDNLVIVITDDAVLVIPKDRVQDLRRCVDKIRQDDGEQWL
jgi:mannose-1-phosphate guanylyltransferase